MAYEPFGMQQSEECTIVSEYRPIVRSVNGRTQQLTAVATIHIESIVGGDGASFSIRRSISSRLRWPFAGADG
jgi:hypothetical protein